MRNKAEVSLSNQTFQDVTAWRAIRNADRKVVEQALVEPKAQGNPVTIFSKDNNTELEFARARLRKLQKEGKITKTQRRGTNYKA